MIYFYTLNWYLALNYMVDATDSEREMALDSPHLLLALA